MRDGGLYEAVDSANEIRSGEVSLSDDLDCENGKNEKYDLVTNIEENKEGLDMVLRFCREHCRYLPYMAGWFVFSLVLSSYNMMVFSSGHLNFPCPLTLTSIHFFIQWLLSYSLCIIWPDQFGNGRIDRMSWREFLDVSIPCGMMTALDIGLSNLSLVRISLTLYTMVKSSAPIFVLFFAVSFGLEKLSLGLIGVVTLIVLGEFIICAYGELQFDVIGFVCILSATGCSGLRWTLIQLKLKTLDPPLKSSIATMRVLSPTMGITLLLLAFAFEKPWDALSPRETDYFVDMAHGFRTMMLGVAGGCLAVAMVWCELSLLIQSSAIIVMLGGVIKELMTIFVGAEFFGDNVNAKNLIGCSVVFSGVILYKYLFHIKKDVASSCDSNDNESLKTLESEALTQTHDD